jgi:hypothetical protein
MTMQQMAKALSERTEFVTPGVTVTFTPGSGDLFMLRGQGWQHLMTQQEIMTYINDRRSFREPERIYCRAW